MIRLIVTIICFITCTSVMMACSGASTFKRVKSTKVNDDFVSIQNHTGLVIKDEEVLLVPHLEAGWAGWCMTTVTASGYSGCGGVKSHLPVVAEGWSSGDAPPSTQGAAVVEKQVAFAKVDGSVPIPTRVEERLPGGLRSISIQVKGKALLEESSRIPRFEPLNANGEAISPSVARDRLAISIPTRSLKYPSHPSEGICRISRSGLGMFTAHEGLIVTQIKSYRGLVGAALLSCASTVYKFGQSTWTAVVYLDAAHPGARPGPIPGMVAIPGHRGIFSAPGQETAVMVRRIRDAWLVVGGAINRQGLRLLDQLRVTLHFNS